MNAQFMGRQLYGLFVRAGNVACDIWQYTEQGVAGVVDLELCSLARTTKWIWEYCTLG